MVDDFAVTGQLWSLATTSIQVCLRVQLNSILFAKTLVRKDIASSAAPQQGDGAKDKANQEETAKKDDEGDFSSKAQVMTLMTTDVDRVSEFPWHAFSLVDSPVEIAIGTIFLYHLLGGQSSIKERVSSLILVLNQAFLVSLVWRLHACSSLSTTLPERLLLVLRRT